MKEDKNTINTLLKEVIDEFFSKLENDKEIPVKIIEKLKKCSKSDDLNSKNKILESIELENLNED